MKVTLESTSKIVDLIVGPLGCTTKARIWEGHTDSGIEVHAFVTRIAVDKDPDTSQFERELLEQRPPSVRIADVYPARMFLP
jgi:hypothetical protein